MDTTVLIPSAADKAARRQASPCPGRSWFGNRFVYLVVSQRARGLSVGINLNPDKACNFDCIYCEVDRTGAQGPKAVDTCVMAAELEAMLLLLHSQGVRSLPGFADLSDELCNLKEVALSGDGEPTLCPNFEEALESVLHVRARSAVPFFKIVLITNGTALHREQVGRALNLLTFRDEIWIKLDVGTQAELERINRPRCLGSDNSPCLQMIVHNIIRVGRQRPVVIQSLFPSLDGRGPGDKEIAAYLECLEKIRAAGAKISLVQVYSVHRPAIQSNCRHLPLHELSAISKRIRAIGLKAEVF